jgi:hypothetical protein
MASAAAGTSMYGHTRAAAGRGTTTGDQADKPYLLLVCLEEPTPVTQDIPLITVTIHCIIIWVVCLKGCSQLQNNKTRLQPGSATSKPDGASTEQVNSP